MEKVAPFHRKLFLPELLQKLGFNPRLVAVEYNGEILHHQFLVTNPNPGW